MADANSDKLTPMAWFAIDSFIVRINNYGASKKELRRLYIEEWEIENYYFGKSPKRKPIAKQLSLWNV